MNTYFATSTCTPTRTAIKSHQLSSLNKSVSLSAVERLLCLSRRLRALPLRSELLDGHLTGGPVTDCETFRITCVPCKPGSEKSTASLSAVSLAAAATSSGGLEVSDLFAQASARSVFASQSDDESPSEAAVVGRINRARSRSRVWSHFSYTASTSSASLVLSLISTFS